MKKSADPALPKEERVLEAATEVFRRYGFARTTMGDIAERAGISRPALYLIYANKEKAFAAVIRRMDDDQHALIRRNLRRLKTFEEKLLFACRTWGAYGVDLMVAHPDARDLFDLAFLPVQDVYSRFQAFLTDLLAEPAAASDIDVEPEEMARVIVFAMKGFKAAVADGRDMRHLISIQVLVVAAALRG